MPYDGFITTAIKNILGQNKRDSMNVWIVLKCLCGWMMWCGDGMYL